MTGARDSAINIAGRTVGAGNPVFVIAEIGINHGGDEALCARMIEAAAKTGADAVKLQTVTPEASYHPDTESYRLFRDAVLTRESMGRLADLAARNGIILFSTPGDPPALDLLRDLDHPAIKISSGLLTNLPLLRMAAQTGKPLILSTGMARLEEVEEAVSLAHEAGATQIAVLQCTSLYPAPADTLNLNAIASLEMRLGVPVGYSDHHDGALACIAAVAAGARLIEKHFTLDPGLAGADHAISLDPADFAGLVNSIRQVEAMLGSADKRPVEAELQLRSGRHRRLVAARDLESGETLEAEDILLMRLPAKSPGLDARAYDDVIGRRVRCAVPRLGGLTADVIEGFE